jgi:hypothetical protein
MTDGLGDPILGVDLLRGSVTTPAPVYLELTWVSECQPPIPLA